MQATNVTRQEAIDYLNDELQGLLNAAIEYSGDRYEEHMHRTLIRSAKVMAMAVNALRGLGDGY